MDIQELFRRAAAKFGQLVDQIPQQQWSAPTPNDDWDVKALVNHVVNELLWVEPLMAGRTTAQVGNSLDGDLLGDQPVQSVNLAIATAVEAFGKAKAMEQIVHLSAGETAARQYCAEVASDIAVHSWDLAQSIGANTTIDPDLLSLIDQTFGPIADGARANGAFGPRITVPDNASQQTKVLAMTGRRG